MDTTVRQPHDHTLRVDSIGTRYWAVGGQGAPMVLIHGLGGYVENWLPTLNALAAHHRVIALDLPGHGLTDKPADGPCEIEALAAFVRSAMTALGIERAHIVGHSVGGAVATRLTLIAPGMVDRLVLVASAGLGREIHPLVRLSSAPILGELLTRPSRKGSADFLKTCVHDPAHVTDAMIDLDYRMGAQPGAQAAALRVLRAVFTPLGQKQSLCDAHLGRLGSIAQRTLVVWGRQDRVIPAAHGDAAARGLRNAQAHVFDACGHMPMIEHADAFNALLLSFLRQA